MSDYLAHYGILGMKWGIRRFQPYSVRGRKSGKSGKEIGAAKASKINKEKLFEQTIKSGKDRPNVSPAEKVFGESGKIADRSGRLVRFFQKAKNVNSKRESKTLSDAELQKRINRLELEKRYETLSTEDLSRGKITVQEIIDSIGDVLAIGGSAATIYAVYKMVKA